MSRARTSRHRLTTAVTVALAVTVGTLTAAPTALAATGAVTAGAEEAPQAASELPPGSLLIGNGPSGFLTRSTEGTKRVYRWTRSEDGVTTVLPEGTYYGGLRSDLVVKMDGTVHTLYDMATGADPVVIDIAPLGPSARLSWLAGSSLVVYVTNATGGTDIHIVGKPGGTFQDRKVTGLPANTTILRSVLGSPDTLALLYTGTVGGVSGKRLALVDTVTGAVVDDRATPAAYEGDTVEQGRLSHVVSSVSASATHVAWTEKSAAGTVDLVVARRGGSAVQRIPLTTLDPVVVHLLGDWVTYGVTGAATAFTPNPFYSLTARSLTSERTVEVLDSVDRVRGESDDQALFQGGTIAGGQGLYRVATDETGTPAAKLVASTGEPTTLGVEDSPNSPSPAPPTLRAATSRTWCGSSTSPRSSVSSSPTPPPARPGPPRTACTAPTSAEPSGPACSTTTPPPPTATTRGR